MQVTANYVFSEEYTPPRCRKPRCRNVDGAVVITIKEICEDDAPIAMITTTHESRRVDGQQDTVFGLVDTVYRWFKKRLYTPCISQSGSDIGKQYTMADVMCRIHETSYLYDATKDERIKQIKKNASRYLIIDGTLYEQSGEPRYSIVTFGLGHNHGGTGFFVTTHYNSNLSKDSFFNANQRDEALAYFKRVALGRGDTKSVSEGKEEKNIKVLIPEAVKCNPQKEHGSGCPFLNSLESIVSGSSSVFDAGLGAIAFTLAETSSVKNIDKRISKRKKE